MINITEWNECKCRSTHKSLNVTFLSTIITISVGLKDVLGLHNNLYYIVYTNASFITECSI